MLTYYIILDIKPDSSDEEIRNKYLQLVKKHSPEKAPEKFKKITEAYEMLKYERSRIQGKILGGLTVKNCEQALISLAKAKDIKRKRSGLKELFEVEKNI